MIRAMERETDERFGLTPAVSAEIGKAVAQGIPAKEVAESYGISRYMLDKYLKDGEEDLQKGLRETQCAILWMEVHKGRNEFVKKAVAMIGEGAKEDWRGAAYLLERVAPDDFLVQQKNFNESNERIVVVNDVPKEITPPSPEPIEVNSTPAEPKPSEEKK